MKTETTLSRPVRIVVIGAGNRAAKCLEYARRNPEQAQVGRDRRSQRPAPPRHGRRLRTSRQVMLRPLRRLLRQARCRHGADFDSRTPISTRPSKAIADAGYRPARKADRPASRRMPRNRPARPPARRAGRRLPCAALPSLFRQDPRAGRFRGGWDTSFRSTIPLRSDSTGPPTATCAASSGARAKPIRSCWPNAVTTSTSCCG